MRSFVRRDGRKAVIVKSGGTGGFRHGAVDRSRWEHIANASAQLAVQVKRGENSARLGQVRGWRIERNLSSLQCGRNRIVGQAQQKGSLLGRKFMGNDFRCDGG